MYVCVCAAVTDRQVDTAILAGADTVEAVGDSTGAGTGCGGCQPRICTRLAALGVSRVDASRLVALSA